MLEGELGRLQVGPLLWRAWALTEECLLVEFVTDGLDKDLGSDVSDAEFVDDYNRNQECLKQFLEIKKLRDDVEWVPSYRSIGGWFDREKLNHQELWNWVKGCLKGAAGSEVALMAKSLAGSGVDESTRDIELPICYELGLDWERIENVSVYSRAEWITQHSAGRYRVAAIGFLPGFVFLDGLDDSLQIPRLELPRTKVPEGTVGIGGRQTGWYAIESPGGWNSIGRMPLPLLDLGQADGSPTPVQVGDWVRFRSISVEEFEELASDAMESEPISNEGAKCNSSRTLSRIRIQVLDAGLWTSIQDGGRTSGQAYGIPKGGVADVVAWKQLKSLLNIESIAVFGPVLECTLKGPRLKFLDNAMIALTGAIMEARVDGKLVKRGSRIRVRAGEVLELGTVKQGCRAYMGIASTAFVGKLKYGSYSQLPGAGRLQRGEILEWMGFSVEPSVGENGPWLVSSYGEGRLLPEFSGIPRLRIQAGPEWALVPKEFKRLFLESDFVVGSQSNRMGIRLKEVRKEGSQEVGNGLLDLWEEFREYWVKQGSMWSSVVAPGVIQLPPNAEPIMLGPDGQTLGGYPRIAYLPKDQQWRAAQFITGDRLRFRMT